MLTFWNKSDELILMHFYFYNVFFVLVPNCKIYIYFSPLNSHCIELFQWWAEFPWWRRLGSLKFEEKPFLGRTCLVVWHLFCEEPWMETSAGSQQRL